uniref:Uncharacterized protein n=1 Tax=Myoviridae sp. ctiil21 TaxID=2825153 RepID=A0A8S5P7Q0_9CAUD|nr:MAG TPA: hypothetical protein [Myoviridae sp. ctiil21]
MSRRTTQPRAVTTRATCGSLPRRTPQIRP